MTEIEPNGLDPHAPGAKMDDGKLLAGILQQYTRALTAVLEVATFGAKKYSRGGWQYVDNGVERYTDAMFRHLLAEPVEPVDPDSGLAHDAHVAWNALSRLEMRLRQDAGLTVPQHDTGKGVRMKTECPYCNEVNDVEGVNAKGRITCHGCGNYFYYIPDETDTSDACLRA